MPVILLQHAGTIAVERSVHNNLKPNFTCIMQVVERSVHDILKPKVPLQHAGTIAVERSVHDILKPNVPLQHAGTIAVERSVHDILKPNGLPPAAAAKASLPNGVHKPAKPSAAAPKGKPGKPAGSGKSANAAAVDPAQQMREQQLAEETQVIHVPVRHSSFSQGRPAVTGFLRAGALS